jgi:NAD+ diphosphatase
MNFIPAITLDGEPTPQALEPGLRRRQAAAARSRGRRAGSRWPAAPAGMRHAEVRHYLGRLDGLDCWALKLQAVPEGWRPVPLRAAMMGFPESLAGLAGRASQVLDWDRTHRFCGACGTPTEHQAGERARRCPACGHTAYPRISPAMMALVWRPGEVLLARAPHFVNRHVQRAGRLRRGRRVDRAVHPPRGGRRGGRAGRRPALLRQPELAVPEQPDDRLHRRWTGGDIVPQAGEIEDAQWFPTRRAAEHPAALLDLGPPDPRHRRRDALA